MLRRLHPLVFLTLALLFAVLSFAGHVILFAGVAGRGGHGRIDLVAGLQINLAANAATRLFASAGAGGIACCNESTPICPP